MGKKAHRALAILPLMLSIGERLCDQITPRQVVLLTEEIKVPSTQMFCGVGLVNENSWSSNLSVFSRRPLSLVNFVTMEACSKSTRRESITSRNSSGDRTDPCLRNQVRPRHALLEVSALRNQTFLCDNSAAEGVAPRG